MKKSSIVIRKIRAFAAVTAFSVLCSASLSALPVVKTADSKINSLVQLAQTEVQKNIRSDGTFCAGANWPTAWTRDMSYAIDLGLSFLFPEAVEKSLASRVENGIILQDTGSGGSWPVSTDRITWITAAYDYALFKQSPEYFEWVYSVAEKTLAHDYQVNFDKEKGIFRGESSFLDWREQTYPRWATNEYIAESYALGTNMMYFSALEKVCSLAKITGKSEETVLTWKKRSEELKNAIIKKFWLEEKKYFASILLKDIYTYTYEGYETLGESLGVILGVAPEDAYKNVIGAVKPQAWGLSVVAPQLSTIPSYHNDAVWPFVQGYRGLASKKAGDAYNAEYEFKAMVKAAEKFGTFKENYVASSFSPETQTNSDRQLWSDAGFLAYIYRIFFGIEFTENGIAVRPFIFDSEEMSAGAGKTTDETAGVAGSESGISNGRGAGDSASESEVSNGRGYGSGIASVNLKALAGGIKLEKLAIGKTTLSIEVTGSGDTVKSFKLNGAAVSTDYVIPYESLYKNGASPVSIQIALKKSEDFSKSYDETSRVKPLFDAATVTPQVPNSISDSDGKKTDISFKPKNKGGWKILKDAAESALTAKNAAKATDKNEMTLKAGDVLSVVQAFAVPEASSVKEGFQLEDIPLFPSKSVRTENYKNTTLLEAESADVHTQEGSRGTEKQMEVFKARITDELSKTDANFAEYVKDFGKEEGDYILFTFEAKKTGDYAVDFRFKNGHGPINTGEKCAVLALSADDMLVRRLAFPQQGSWVTWNFTAPTVIHLEKGKHTIRLSTDDWCRTQHGALNPIHLDLMRVARVR